VKLLVGDVRDGDVRPLLEGSIQTRLGEGFFESRLLRPEAIERTAAAATVFREEATRFEPSRIRLLATAAAREASNRDALVQALRDATGIEPEVIAGETEAALAFRGVCTAPGLARTPLLVTDLGGGSTEFIVGRCGLRRFSRSFALGAVRLLDQIRPSDPPTAADLARCRADVDALLAAEVVPGVAAALANEIADETPGAATVTYVAVGGSAVILARIAVGMSGYDRARIEGTPLAAATVGALVDRLWNMPLGQRRSLPGLPPERADIILTGAVIHERILAALGLPSVSVSTRGLRFAALLDPDPTP
jgi:exopolyphosphatase/guanosine-5'-triphosphate,3'-diphosphate pyrophosphatase